MGVGWGFKMESKKLSRFQIFLPTPPSLISPSINPWSLRPLWKHHPKGLTGITCFEKKTNLDFSTSPIFGSTCSPATSNQPGSSSGLKKSMAIDCNRDDTSGGSRIINYDPPTKIIHYDPPRRIIHYDPPTRMIIYGPPGGSCEASLATFLPSSSFSSGILCSPMIQWRYF